MSLPAIAQHMSSYGRNGDTMLVHMTPSEVHGLQALAEKHGTTLTINPHTGLPEAFGLKDFVKAAAPIALGAALGPAGFGLASSAMGAGLMVGGVTALATGNLKQGLMAGLGAYGGYGLSEGLAGLGAEEIAQQQADDMIVENAAKKASESAAQTAADAATTGTASETALNTTQQAAANQQSLANALQTPPPTAAGEMVKTTVAAPSTAPSYFDKISTGFNQATGTGGLDALNQHMAANAASTTGGPSSALGAAGYMAAGALGSGAFDEKQDLSKAKLDAGYIRPYTYNPFGQKYTAYTPVKADEWGSRTLASGGIVALADGGSLADQRLEAYKQLEAAQQPQAAPAPVRPAPSDASAFQTIKNLTGPNTNYSDQQLASLGWNAGITPEQAARVTGTPIQQMQQRVAAAPYNTMTGGSKAAYDYLIGSGEYPTRPYTPTGEIYKPYAEATMGMKADPTQFATTFNPATRQYENNPNYKPFTYDMSTGQETRGLSGNEINKLISDPKNLTVTKPEKAPSGWFGGMVEKLADNETRPYWMVANNLTYDDLSRATGSSVADVMKRFPKTATPTASTPVPASDSGAGATGGLMPNDLSYATGGITALAGGGQGYNLGGYSDGGRLLRGPGDGVSDSIPASIGNKQPARLADGEFVVPARIVSELGNGSTDAGARKLYQMMDRVQKARGKTTGKGKVATNSRSEKYLPA